jgi:hypothetical protein
MFMAGRGERIMVQPFFTIGVPSYNRRDLLLETLSSILSQGLIRCGTMI